MVAKITINSNNLITIEAIEDVLEQIDKKFTFPDYSDCWVWGKFRKERVVLDHFIVRNKKVKNAAMLPIGLLSQLVEFLNRKRATFKVFDKRVFDTYELTDSEIENSLGYLTLYDYQVACVRACLNNPIGIIKRSTASGKTEIFIALCKIMNKKTLILFARIDLAHQTLKRMKKAGLDAGMVQGNNVDENHQVVMATVQSGHKLQDQYEMIVVDEMHRASSKKYRAILRASDFKYRYGFSATPYVKRDKIKNAYVNAWLGEIIYEVKSETLMEKGKIAKPKIKFIPIDFPKNIIEYKSWMAIEKLGIVENEVRNKIISKIAQRLEGQILILVIKIDQGEILNKLIPNSHLLYGKSKIKERADIVKRFDGGEPITIIASTIFDEGIDIKNINHVIICGGGSSFIKTIQRLGRGLRVTETKKDVDIFDFMDNTNKTLTKHSKNRIKSYREEGFDDITILKGAELLELIK